MGFKRRLVGVWLTDSGRLREVCQVRVGYGLEGGGPGGVPFGLNLGLNDGEIKTDASLFRINCK